MPRSRHAASTIVGDIRVEITVEQRCFKREHCHPDTAVTQGRCGLKAQRAATDHDGVARIECGRLDVASVIERTQQVGAARQPVPQPRDWDHAATRASGEHEVVVRERVAGRDDDLALAVDLQRRRSESHV